MLHEEATLPVLKNSLSMGGGIYNLSASVTRMSRSR